MIELEEDTAVEAESGLPKKWFASVTQIDTWKTETYMISASTKLSAYWTLMANLDSTWNLDHLEEV